MSDHMKLPSPDYRDDVPLDTPTLGLEELTQVSVKAVDQIGIMAAAEIRVAASAVRSQADQVARKLEELARAVEEHSNLAGAHVEDFIKNAMQMLEAVRSTQARNGNGGPPQQ